MTPRELEIALHKLVLAACLVRDCEGPQLVQQVEPLRSLGEALDAIVAAGGTGGMGARRPYVAPKVSELETMTFADRKALSLIRAILEHDQDATLVNWYNPNACLREIKGILDVLGVES